VAPSQSHLLVVHSPVDLVVVTGTQINHDVLVPAAQQENKAGGCGGWCKERAQGKE
jgi:hypothetical protein